MKLSTVFENLILASALEAAPASRTGRPRALSDSQVTTLLFKLLRTGCQWRELECGTASFMAVYRRLQLWEWTNVIEDAYKRALQTYSKLRPPKRHLMDSSHVRNRHGRQPNTGRNHVDRGRQGTKVSVVTDDARIVYGMHLAPSNHPDVVLLDETLGWVGALRRSWVRLSCQSSAMCRPKRQGPNIQTEDQIHAQVKCKEGGRRAGVCAFAEHAPPLVLLRTANRNLSPILSTGFWSPTRPGSRSDSARPRARSIVRFPRANRLMRHCHHHLHAPTGERARLRVRLFGTKAV